MSRLLPIQEGVEVVISPETPVIEYTPDPIDEYMVVVNDSSDWQEIHDYIINENEIDGIPNRRITCTNPQEHSLRSSIYLMSVEEAEVLKSHPKVEDVELNPEKYPQPQSTETLRYKKEVGFNKPQLVAALDTETTSYNNGVRSNWSHLFVNNPTSAPFKGVGITSTTFATSDLEYSLTGRGVDAVIIDSGVAHLHPEFLRDDGTYRVKDVILDGPYKVDPVYFDNLGATYTKVVDGVEIGVGIATVYALDWWSNSASRSVEFSSLGTASISSLYTVEHVSTKTVNDNNNQLIDGHGTACASQIGGKSFGLAFECNLWNIRISLGGVGGIIAGSTALNVCAIWHDAKRIAQNGDPDPTIINNSWGQTSSTGNTNLSTYSHGYRGSTLQYTGNGSSFTVQSNAGACRNVKSFSYNSTGSSLLSSYGGSGQYTPHSTSSSSGAENAIAAGCIVVTSAGNQNQKFSDETDVDFDNWYSSSSNYTNRCGGVSRGFTGTHERKKGSIRVGALDCSVEPADSKQGSTAYAIRRVVYSNNGPMVNVWAPAEMSMAAGYYGSYEDYQRQDDSGFYDTWFNGTSSASPNACSVIALYLESNRKANQAVVHDWLERHGSVEIDLSDPYPDPTETGYWTQSYNATYDAASSIGDSYNIRGNSCLRGAPKRVLRNPFATNEQVSISGVEMSGILFTQS